MNAHDLHAALAQLEAGRVVAVATESFFGLLADITNPLAVEALFGLKPRGADKGVPTLLPSRAAWAELVAGEIPELAQAFASALWPGGLSIALPASSKVAARVALDGTLAVRLPGASAAAELAAHFGRPLSATSANLPGAPPATHSAAVEAAFAAAIELGTLLVLPGESPGGAPSTVVAVTGEAYRVARVGAVPVSALDAIANERTHGA
ncbi:MAG TPA: L-threonylcarbamoyladenylate synthase [Polyangiaceae bacterium]|jgi:L-threonylcarbamoyladenylate synthase|nr:L-threonylcarbamoyladenylate synthase [Polyangiaceae bacterium]